jgi:hypothetical protein
LLSYHRIADRLVIFFFISHQELNGVQNDEERREKIAAFTKTVREDLNIKGFEVFEGKSDGGQHKTKCTSLNGTNKRRLLKELPDK